MIRKARGFISGLAAPFAAWLLSKAVVSSAAASLSLNPLEPLTWARFDSYQYMDIAARGYRLVYMPRTMNGHTTLWGGNAIVWPLFSWLSRGAAAGLGCSLPAAALALSSSFHLIALSVLWLVWLRREERTRALLLIGLAAVFPGAVYYAAISAVPLFIALALLYLALLERERWAAAAAVGFLAGMAHTSSLFLPAAALAAAARRPERLRLLGAAAAAAGALAGFVLVFVVMRLDTGDWAAAPKSWEFFRYTGGWSLLQLRQRLYMPPLTAAPLIARIAVISQGMLVAGLCGLALRRKPGAGPVLTFALVYWLAPHVSPLRQSFYRNDACVLPVLTLLGRVPRRQLIILLAAASVIAFMMAREFFAGVLI